MKTQVILVIFSIFILMEVTHAGFIGAAANWLKNAIGRRSLSDLDSFDYMYDPSLSAADLKALEKLFQD